MPSPTTNNQTASIVNQILKNLIEGAGQDAVEAELISLQPWLALPFIKQIFEFILGLVSGAIYKQAAYAATQIVIDTQVSLEESKTYGAFQTLQMAIASGDKAAIDKASQDLDAAYGALINYDGSASV